MIHDQIHTFIGPSVKGSPVGDLSFMDPSCPELNFTLQIDTSWRQQPLVNVRIHSSNRETEFRMVGADLVGRLSLGYQWCYDLIHIM